MCLPKSLTVPATVSQLAIASLCDREQANKGLPPAAHANQDREIGQPLGHQLERNQNGSVSFFLTGVHIYYRHTPLSILLCLPARPPIKINIVD